MSTEHTTPEQLLIAAQARHIAALEALVTSGTSTWYDLAGRAIATRHDVSAAEFAHAAAPAPAPTVATVEAWGAHVGGGPHDGWLTLRAPGGAFDGLPEGARVLVTVLP